MPAPLWLSLLSPLPPEAMAQRKPVASAAQLEEGTAGPIAGWHSVTVNLSEPEYGLRHVQVTLDEHGKLLAASDHVMFVRETTPDGEATITDHESIGGRFEHDGSFRGTHWNSRFESRGLNDEDSVTTGASKKTADRERDRRAQAHRRRRVGETIELTSSTTQRTRVWAHFGALFEILSVLLHSQCAHRSGSS